MRMEAVNACRYGWRTSSRCIRRIQRSLAELYALVHVVCADWGAHLQSIDARCCGLCWALGLGRAVCGNVQKQVLLISICSWSCRRRRTSPAMRRVVVFHSAAGARVVFGRLAGACHSSRRWRTRAGGGVASRSGGSQ